MNSGSVIRSLPPSLVGVKIQNILKAHSLNQLLRPTADDENQHATFDMNPLSHTIFFNHHGTLTSIFLITFKGVIVFPTQTMHY